MLTGISIEIVIVK